jgi:hypothetical protein
MAQVKQKEKVVQLFEEGGSIGTLNDIIEAIRNKQIRNFAVILQKDGSGEISTFGKEEDKPATDKDIVTQYYFFGEDHVVSLMGMVKRLSHILDLYMDGVDIFGDNENEEE